MAAELSIEPLNDRPNAYRVVGEMDMSNAGELRRLGEPRNDVYLDLSGLSFMDSAGLRALIEMCHDREPDHAVVVLDPSDAVERLFQVTGVERVPNLRIETG